MNELIERYVATFVEPIPENQRSEVRIEIRGAIGEMVDQRIEAGKSARSWSLPFLLRHTCYRLMDHAWEMEDKDLTGSS